MNRMVRIFCALGLAVAGFSAFAALGDPSWESEPAQVLAVPGDPSWESGPAKVTVAVGNDFSWESAPTGRGADA